MERGDTQTKTFTRSPGGSYQWTILEDFLRYLGYSEKEIESGEIQLTFKAEFSKTHGQTFIGFGKPFKKD